MSRDNAALAGKRDRYHHGDLRRDLLRVAREEISRHGTEGMTLASLARRAGVSQPAPYRHFADRKALLEAVAAEGFQALAGNLANAVASETSPGASASALALAYVSFGEANIELYRLMFASRLTPDAKTGGVLDIVANDALNLLRRSLGADGRRACQLLDRDVYRAWAQLHGLVMLKADGFITSPLASYVPLLQL